MAKYKVGDKVRIKDNIESIIGACSEMCKYRGMTFEVSSLRDGGKYYIFAETGGYWWSDNMVEGVDSTSFELIGYSSHIKEGIVTFTKGSETCSYGPATTSDKEWYWLNSQGLNSLIFKWLGLEDLAEDIAIYATNSSHPKYYPEFWPFSYTKSDNNKVMECVMSLVLKYNELQYVEKLREYVKSQLAKSPTKSSPEPYLPLSGVNKETKTIICSNPVIAGDLAPQCIPFLNKELSTTLIKPIAGKLRPADREVKLTINKHRTYKVKSR